MKKIMLIISLCWMGLVILNGCGKKSTQAEKSIKIPVKLAPVVSKPVKIPIHASGRLVTDKEQKLSFKIGGIIQKIEVDEGMTVTRGQRLAQLNLVEIEAGVAQAKNAVEKATRDLERVRQLHADQVATLEQLQEATTGQAMVQANLAAAEFNWKHARIYAPGDGKILKRLFSENEMVNAGMPVLVWGSTDGWVVRVGLAEQEVVRIHHGDSANVSFDSYPTVGFPATVTEVAEAIDPASGTFEVELRLRPTRNRLLTGFVAKTEIFPATPHPLFLIPIAALVEGQGLQASVFTVDSQLRAQKIAVAVAHLFADQAGISSGLNQVSAVVTDGAAYLSDGSLVEIISPENSNSIKKE